MVDYIKTRCDFSASHWCELKTVNQFKDVWPKTYPDGVYGVEGPNGAMNDWTSAAYDQKGNVYFAAGGGHFGYGGNEVYRLSFSDLRWTRITDPSPLVTVDRNPKICKVPKDGPSAMHHYDTEIYYPPNNSIYMWESVPYRVTTSCKLPSPPKLAWRFSLDDRKWYPLPNPPKYLGYGATTLLKNKIVYLGGPYPAYATIFDPKTETYSPLVGSPAYGVTGNMITVGNAAYFQWAPQTCGSCPRHMRMVKITEGIDGKPVLANLGTNTTSFHEFGFAWDSAKKLFVWWDGGRNIFTTPNDHWPPPGKEINLTWYSNRNGPAPVKSIGRLYGAKFLYIPQLDVFFGYEKSGQNPWVYKLPDTPDNPNLAPLKAKGYTCDDNLFTWQCPKVQQLIDKTPAGGTLKLPKGIYVQAARIAKPITLDANGSHFMKRTYNGKAALVIDADSTVMNLECSEITSPDGNGACIRQQTPNLTLKHVHFHDSQEGVLTNNQVMSLTVDDSLFENLGGAVNIKRGRAHGIYFSSGRPGSKVTISHSTFRHGKEGGHLIKSGAETLLITDSTLDERGGSGSRMIDAFNGGTLIIRNSTLEGDRNDGNPEMIGYDYEARVSRFPENLIEFDGDKVHCNGATLLGGRNALETAKRVNVPSC